MYSIIIDPSNIIPVFTWLYYNRYFIKSKLLGEIKIEFSEIKF